MDLADLVPAGRMNAGPASPRRGALVRLLRQPLLHFAVAGALLHALGGQAPARPAPLPPALSAEAVEQLRQHWLRDSGRAPTQTELAASIARERDEQLLLSEALALGLDLQDPVARARLLANMRFAYPTRRAADATLLEEARALGMPRSDLVVRRRLVQVMERRLLRGVPYDAAALARYIAEHPERYAQPARYTLTQIYFAPATPLDRGAPAQLAATLARGEAPEIAGEPFLLGARIGPATAAEIAARYGAEFAAQVVRRFDGAAPGHWQGPLRSPYGAHWLRLEALAPAADADFEAVQARALRAWLAEQRPQQLQAALATLRAQRQANPSGGQR